MPQSTVDAWFRAMRRGRAAEAELLALFTDDARYSEPFSGGTHVGRAAIAVYFRSAWEVTPPDLVLTVDRIDVDKDRAVARWCCTSPAFDGPMWGEDRYVVRDGRICELLTTFIPNPDDSVLGAAT